MNKLFENFIAYYKMHKGRVIGGIGGFIIAILVIAFGLFNSLFIALCVFVGYYIGKKFENDKNFIRRILDRILPPGRYR